jgi:hypothetical protein
MPSTLSPMQLAQRVHELLLREVGFSIEAERLVADLQYARDVLLVCDACIGSDLPALAQMLRQAAPAAAPRQMPGHAQQPEDWAHDTSGFGVSQPPPAPGRAAPAAAQPPAVERRKHWLARWRSE